MNQSPNPYAGTTDGLPERSPAVGVLAASECWRLLENESVGRLAVHHHDGAPDVYPVNFRARNGALYLRSGPGGKLRSIASHPAVAFEIDGADDGHRWSVVIRGTAARMDDDAEIEDSGVLGIVPASPTPKHDFVRVTPTSISGRRFVVYSPDVQPRAATATDAPENRTAGPESTGPATKPFAIPHRAPLDSPTASTGPST